MPTKFIILQNDTSSDGFLKDNADVLEMNKGLAISTLQSRFPDFDPDDAAQLLARIEKAQVQVRPYQRQGRLVTGYQQKRPESDRQLIVSLSKQTKLGRIRQAIQEVERKMAEERATANSPEWWAPICKDVADRYKVPEAVLRRQVQWQEQYAKVKEEQTSYDDKIKVAVWKPEGVYSPVPPAEWNILSYEDNSGFISEKSDEQRKSNFKVFSNEINRMASKGIKFDGRGKLKIEVTGDLSIYGAKGQYARSESGEKVIRLDPEYENSLAHEYTHFLQDEYEWHPVWDYPIALREGDLLPPKDLETLYRKGKISAKDFPQWIATRKEKDKTPEQQAFTQLVVDLFPYYVENYKIIEGNIRARAKNPALPKSIRNIKKFSAYFFQPTEMVARAMSYYITDEASNVLEDTPNYKTIVNAWAEKYVRTGIVKALKHIVMLEKARIQVKPYSRGGRPVKGYAQERRVGEEQPEYAAEQWGAYKVAEETQRYGHGEHAICEKCGEEYNTDETISRNNSGLCQECQDKEAEKYKPFLEVTDLPGGIRGFPTVGKTKNPRRVTDWRERRNK